MSPGDPEPVDRPELLMAEDGYLPQALLRLHPRHRRHRDIVVESEEPEA